ncbi:hypothetical protein TrLO_g2926 [Triparma laevis f. longispina]|uniref:Uncharacterized protein n=1 Tax=Triparma laevis f. longispina TaxID=1714387 RepID=A0A9W7KUS1_9STRA|nr:hypothetical protein TrLO_g2926 [Triparma laevis f. longispina]
MNTLILCAALLMALQSLSAFTLNSLIIPNFSSSTTGSTSSSLYSSLRSSSADDTNDNIAEPQSEPQSPSPQSPTDSPWSKFEEVETYKRRCLLLEDALSKKTLLAKKYLSRSTLLQDALSKKKKLQHNQGKNMNTVREVFDEDVAHELERRINSLSSQLSSIHSLNVDLKGDNSGLKNNIEEVSEELRDLEEVLLRLEGEYGEERREWERREEENGRVTEQLRLEIREMERAGRTQPLMMDRDKLTNRLTIVTESLKQTQIALSNAQSNEAKSKKLLKKFKAETERIMRDNEELVEDLLDERRRNLKERELEFVRLERSLEVQRTKYEFEIFQLRRKLAGGGIWEGTKKVAGKVYRVMTPWRRSRRRMY